MLHRIQKYFAGIKPVYIDGGIYVALAFLGAILITLSSDDVFKYSPWSTYKQWPVVVYWAKSVDEWCIATLTALKMFRSTAYADHLNDKSGKIVIDKTKAPLSSGQLENAIINKINEKTTS